jgi:diadenosine tetraphosphate (Ap4A) HIT family hydrolase
MSRKDLYGLLASAAIQRIPGTIPFIIFETDKTIAVKLPSKKTHFHYVIFPKKDIKNIGELGEEDSSYLTDAFLVARHIIEKEKLTRYVMFTNGPDKQDVTYLHFHLVDDINQQQ